jgi:hypothetical protein
MKSMNILTLLVLLAVPVAGVLAFRWVRAGRSGQGQVTHATKEPQWRQSQLEPDTQAGRM